MGREELAGPPGQIDLRIIHQALVEAIGDQRVAFDTAVRVDAKRDVFDFLVIENIGPVDHGEARLARDLL